MATEQEVTAAVGDAIVRLATEAAREALPAQAAAALAAAAKDLAEAAAWFARPNQPH